MIIKSYILEQNIKTIFQKKLFLIYGENQGLKDDIKKEVIKNKGKFEVLRMYQDDILKNEELLINEIKNKSLFEESKIILINDATDKILPLFEKFAKEISNDIIVVFADVLDKKSKLRNFFEKSNEYGVAACYEDNEIQLRKLITSKLKEYKNVTPRIVNLLIQNADLKRNKINNEIDKIKSFFKEKVIDETKIDLLLNIRTNDDFNKLKDVALSGDKIKTNRLLADTVFNTENNIYYLNLINYRINLLKQITDLNIENQSIENIVQSLKPPIFWKDKPIVIQQAKIWNKSKIKVAIKETYETELKLKSNSDINKNVLLKNLIVNLCSAATVS